MLTRELKQTSITKKVQFNELIVWFLSVRFALSSWSLPLQCNVIKSIYKSFHEVKKLKKHIPEFEHSFMAIKKLRSKNLPIMLFFLFRSYCIMQFKNIPGRSKFKPFPHHFIRIPTKIKILILYIKHIHPKFIYH